VDIQLKPLERLLFKTELVLVADFRCRLDEPLFPDSGPSNANCIVFPSTSTRIIRRNGASILENPTAISFLNRGEEYRRERISREGTFATWYTVDDEVLGDLAGHIRFRAPQMPVSASTILEQRQLMAWIRNHGREDSLAAEEGLLSLTRRIFAAREARSTRVNQTMISRATEYLLASFMQPVSLAEIARNVGFSPAYLSRAFHAATGITMSGFRQQLRLIASLDLLPSYAGNVTDLALELGYSSHSHFTSRFRALFGVSPTSYQRSTRRRDSGR
jgi:AraC family transcriptional regulator